jgi:beta-galactosidase
MRPLRRPVDVAGFEIEPLEDLARADALVAKRIDELGLPTWPVDPIDAHVTIHEDAHGVARVAFVMNPTAGDLAVRVSVAGVDALVDATGGGGRVARSGGALEMTVPARSVRMMEIERSRT